MSNRGKRKTGKQKKDAGAMHLHRLTGSPILLPLPKQRGETEIVRKETYRKAGHLTDQELKYTRNDNAQPSLFDSLQPLTQKIIVENKVKETVVEGIKLSPSETKVVDCLSKLLHTQSQTTDATREDYYTGGGFDIVVYGGEETPAPKLFFTLYQLAKEYKGGEAISGKDLDNVKQILNGLDSKRFLLSYVETTKKEDGGRIERKIEEFQKLITVLKVSQTEYSKEDVIQETEEETVILLNPIFRRQIETKFIVYPVDINRRTIIAYGSHNISEIALRLRDYLMREHSSRHYHPDINLENLYLMLAEKWMDEGRKKKVREYTDKALSVVKELGLLLSYEIRAGVKGQAVIVFTLNKDWQ